MHAIGTSLHAIGILAVLAASFASVPQADAAPSGNTITVNVAGTVAGDGLCSFTEAISAANTNVATDGGACPAGSDTGRDTIRFAIGTGARTIDLPSSVTISESVYIDGSSQPGYVGTPLINLRIGTPYMMTLGAGSSNSTIQGLRFTNTYAGDGHGGNINVSSSSNLFIGNYFNTNGTAVTSPRGVGIQIDGGANGNVIGNGGPEGRNLFAGLSGVEIYNSNNTVVLGNFFGVGAGGSTALTNAPADPLQAVNVSGTSTGTTISGNVIARFGRGIRLVGGSSGAVVTGNIIGLGADGSTVLGNVQGVELMDSSSNTIGGPASADRNVIAGNTNINISLSHASDSNVILGNYIGTTVDGLAAVSPAAATGIQLTSGAGNLIGGSAAGAGNVIAGHSQSGITVLSGATGTVLRGNKIGTDKDGLHALPNGVGINLYNSSANIGDAVTPGGNLISGNSAAYYGLYVSGSTGTTIYGNKIGVSEAALPLGNGTGIFLDGGASAQISGNWIAHNTNGGLFVDSGSTATVISANCFTGNASYGVIYMNAVPASFDGNWWGDVDGPTGGGDTALSNAVVSSYLSAPADICGPAVSLSAGTLDFGEQLVGTARAQSLTLTNRSVIALNITDITTGAPYNIRPATTCPRPGSLPIGTTCRIDVRFAPASIGAAPASLVSLSSDNPSGLAPTVLVGTGVAGTPILRNPSFEADAGGDGKPDSYVYVAFSPTTDGQDCVVKKADACSLKLVGNGATKTVTQTIVKRSFGGHDDFTYALWSKASGIPAGSIYRLQVLVYDGATLVTTKTKTFTTGTHPFQQVSGSFSLARAYTKIVFKITLAAPRGSAWFDVSALNRAP